MNTYQWIKGEKAGNIVTSDGTTVLENNQEFLIFQDGSRCNTALMGDYIMEITVNSNGEHDLILLNEIAPTPIQRVEKPKASPNISATYVESPKENKKLSSPVFDLLSTAKKEKRKLNLYIEIEFPSVELLKVISSSYENGTQLINDYIISELTHSQDSSIKSQIASELMKDIINKPTKITKTPKVKNESI